MVTIDEMQWLQMQCYSEVSACAEFESECICTVQHGPATRQSFVCTGLPGIGPDVMSVAKMPYVCINPVGLNSLSLQLT